MAVINTNKCGDTTRYTSNTLELNSKEILFIDDIGVVHFHNGVWEMLLRELAEANIENLGMVACHLLDYLDALKGELK